MSAETSGSSGSSSNSNNAGDNGDQIDFVESGSFFGRVFAASPLGVAAVIAGVVLSLVFLVRFHTILNNTTDTNLHSAIQALQITVVAVWIGVALWGWYLVRDGMERSHTHKRLKHQAQSLSRIERALTETDREKREITQKSRSFWNWRSGERD